MLWLGRRGTARRLDRPADHPEAGGNLRSPGNEGIRCVIFQPTRPPRASCLSVLCKMEILCKECAKSAKNA